MHKNKNLWLKAVAVLALSFSAFPLYAVTQARSAALGELVSGAQFKNLVELPAPAEIAVPEASFEAVLPETRAVAPAPGRDFTPKIEDASRIKSIMKLVADIYSGKPLPYPQDGSIFKNKEGKLPVQPAGFYKEYTLLTGSAPHTVVIGGTTYQVAPDLSARGSERIIIGGGEKIYYTPDHYAHFIQLTVVY
ncbi:MAG: ribonuclease domain-containing protein [Elusimicrobiota bacterium]|nr:ribonuclease domain-containing protein [Elusimicrobiota bacterium]